jgi:hypothetical protein
MRCPQNSIVRRYGNVEHTLTEWSRMVRVPYATLYLRYCPGIPLEEVLFAIGRRPRLGRKINWQQVVKERLDREA